MRLGLGLKFVLLVIGILSVTLAGTTYRLIEDQERILERNLTQQGTALGNFAALIAPQPILAYDFITLDKIVAEIRSNPNVIAAVIRDTEGHPLTSGPGTDSLLGPEMALLLTFPIEHDGTGLGSLDILLDKSREKAEVARLAKEQVGIYGVIFVFLALAFIVAFRHSVLQPVRSLIKGTNRLAEQDFSIPVTVSGNDELGRLGQAFNDMMGEIRDSHQKLEIQARALEQSPAAIVITDADGVIQYVNPKFEAVTGYSAAEAIGRKPSLLKSGETTDAEYKALWETITAGAVWHGEFHNRKRDGTLFWEAASISPVISGDGTITHFVAVKEDITQAKAERMKLDQTLDEYARSNAELERFAYVASHDLQEPLRTISIYAQLLSRRSREKLDHRELEFLDFLVQGAKRMSELVHDILAYSRVTTRGEAFFLVDITRVLEIVRANLAGSVEESGAVIRTRDLPRVRGDELQLVQLFQNLIANAIKFRRPDTPPEITVSAEREGDSWVFEVSDNGIGIAPEYREQIFVIFKRLHTADSYPGTGIGLAICKRIVERHGGEIHAATADGGGTAFRFTLPGENAAAVPEDGTEETGPALS